MQAFICTRKPRSVQARKKTSYYLAIKDSYNEFNSSPEVVSVLYGVVYYFHNQKTELDADNLSKPIWDALEGLVYTDDKIIKLVHPANAYLAQYTDFKRKQKKTFLG